jgi:malonyl-CoA decarboxylase
LRPAYVTLLTQFNALPQGVKFLVDLRADLLRVRDRDDPALATLEAELRRMLSSWFDIGFLELRQLTWDAPAALLERLIHYEAVHAINGWDDLKKRLAPDRRCFAFFHPSMPDEPLIFVWVALVPEMSAQVQSLLDQAQPTQAANSATTAIFYSISNTQLGLQGVSLGNFLIKRVVNALLGELPQLKTFATLSPIPGFARWLAQQVESGEVALDEASREALARSDWYQQAEQAVQLEKVLKPLCARYLALARRGAGALDPVAHFHLSNGAKIERINWLGDTSAKGLRIAHGLMVNYVYQLDEIDRNHERYSELSEVSTSREVRALAEKH